MTATGTTHLASAVCPTPVARPCMVHRWDHITFLHWAYDPAAVARLLPDGLEVETFDGAAWVGLVPFVMQVRPPRVGPIRWMSDFPETNVRTYVRAADGSTGVWFLSLDAARLPAVLTARTTYRLPYFWSDMAATTDGTTWRYRCRRRWPDPRPAHSRVEVAVGTPFEPGELGEQDHWLTARWTLFSRFPRSVWRARAHHPPWQLRRARLLHLDDSLIVAAGLPSPATDPIVHHSEGTEVRISTPERLPR